jgi:glyoxylase-like metal-dependent hydrolase (beta-lactamase superfamily II)
MILDSFPVGPLGSNCTLVGDSATHEAIVIDPGDEAQRIYGKLTAQGLTVRQILLTHAHIDHVSGAAELKELTGAPIYMNAKDLTLLASVPQQASWLGVAPPKTVQPDHGLEDGEVVGLPGLEATVLHTPGHTQGSVCLLFAKHNLLIAGDTLFVGSIGRTDLPGGDYEQIMTSIQTKLLKLPDATRVICGHGSSTTIGTERRNNPFLSPR